jgi:Mg2+-importing ATPase
VIYVIRTSRIPFIESMPGRSLILTSLLIAAAGLIIPFTPLAKPFGFVALPPLYFAILALIVFAYLFLVQGVKSWFIRRFGFD